MRFMRSIAHAAALATIGACSTRTEPTASGNESTIRVRDNLFTPAATTVAAGTTVQWIWEGANQHSVTFSDGPASTVKTTGTFERMFATAGTFTYQCVVHGVSMSGTVTVP